MPECTFLSTYENGVECYKECPLYNCKENGGNCPFKTLSFYQANKYDDFDTIDLENETDLVKGYF